MSCSDLLWDAQSITRKEVPTIQDALACCDKKTLLYVVERFYASRLPGWQNASPQQRRVARKRMSQALDAMRQCSIKRKEGKKRCVFPYEEFAVLSSGGKCIIERMLQARMIGVSGMQQEAASSCCMHNVGSQFDCQPWSKALACRIWLEGPWDCQERYMVLADIFWQLTHQGFGDPAGKEASSRQVWLGPSREKQVRFSALRSENVSDGVSSGRSSCAYCPCEEGASAGELRDSLASAMGLGVPEALEETYQERLIQRVARLNEAGQQEFNARVLRFSERLHAA